MNVKTVDRIAEGDPAMGGHLMYGTAAEKEVYALEHAESCYNVAWEEDARMDVLIKRYADGKALFGDEKRPRGEEEGERSNVNMLGQTRRHSELAKIRAEFYARYLVYRTTHLKAIWADVFLDVENPYKSWDSMRIAIAQERKRQERR